MISDNGSTFVATGKWIKVLKTDENLANYLASQSIKWRFNLSRAPWWGGIFERLIGIMKAALSKVIGRNCLSYCEIEEVLLDVECSMNNRPLCYPEEDIEFEVLTPSLLLRGRPAVMLEEDLQQLEDKCMTKRLRFVKECKDHLRKRWMSEYIYALEERNRKDAGKDPTKVPPINAIVLLKEDVKDKAQLRIARVEDHITGNDDVIRGLKLRLGNGYLIERPLQLVSDLEMGTCNKKLTEEDNGGIGQNLSLRPDRKAKSKAKQNICQVITEEERDF